MKFQCFVFYISLMTTTIVMFYSWKKLALFKETPHVKFWYMELKLQMRKLDERCKHLMVKEKLHVLPKNFLYFPERRLLWCQTYNTGSSLWQQVVTYFDLIGSHGSVTNNLTHQRHVRIKDMAMLERALSKKPVVFAVVQHPFTRLVAAFQDVRTWGNQTFDDFLLLVLQEARSFKTDEHNRMDFLLKPFYRMCSLCSMDFTLIAKFENFDSDRAKILELAGFHVDMDTQLSNKDDNSCKVTREYFKNTPISVKRELRKVYALDFKLLNYDKFLF